MEASTSIIPPTILVVEDSPDDAMVVGLTFQEAGIANPIAFVEDGEQAIHYLTGQGIYADRDTYPLPMLIILDINLPRYDGFEVLEITQGIRRERAIPTVVLSVSDHVEDRRRALALSAQKIMQKPIQPQMLMRLISEITSFSLLIVPNASL